MLHSSSICSASESDSPSRLAHLIVTQPRCSSPSSSCSTDRQPHVSILRNEFQPPFDPHLSCSHLSLLLSEASKDSRLCSALVSIPHPYSGVARTPQRTSNAFTLDGRGKKERSQSIVATGEDRGLAAGVSYGGRIPAVRWGDRATTQTLNHHQRQESQLVSQRARRSVSLASQSTLSLCEHQSTDGANVRLTTASSMLDCQNGNDWSTRCHDDRNDDGCHGDRLAPQSSPKLATVNKATEKRKITSELDFRCN